MGGVQAKELVRPASLYSVYPDKVEGEDRFVCDPSKSMRIYENKGKDFTPLETVTSVFAQAAQRAANRPAYHFEEKGGWTTRTWGQYYGEACQSARALISLGFQAHDCINVIGFNSREWFIAEVGAILAGGIVAGVYTTNAPNACQYISEHSRAKVVFCDGLVQLNKYLQIKDELPNLTTLVVWGDDVEIPSDASSTKVQVLSFTQFMALGTKATEAEQKELDGKLGERMNAQEPGHCAALIYTSGTTGKPKAVMMSHDNLNFTCRNLMDLFGFCSTDDERAVSYLPLSHIAAQLADLLSPIYATAKSGTQYSVSTYFALPTALKGTLGVTLNAAQPTMFFGVPRVWEKFKEKISSAPAPEGLKATLVGWATGLGAEVYSHADYGDPEKYNMPFMYGMAQSLHGKLYEKLGLTKCRAFIVGAAPVKKETLQFFGSWGISLCNVYGMSECCGLETVSTLDFQKTLSCGPALPGCEIKLYHDPICEGKGQEKKEGKCCPKANEGEICFRGRHVMMGYMYAPEKTAEAIDEEGWLHSGDVGRLDKDGFLFITGRIKELIVTGGGENIAPVPIEQALLKNCPALANVMMVGDKKKFCSVLVTLQEEKNETGQAAQVNEDGSINLAGKALEVSADSKTVQDAQNDPKWAAYINAGIAATNKGVVSNAAKLRTFKILDRDFSAVGDKPELGPTLKLIRPNVHKTFTPEITKMYEDAIAAQANKGKEAKKPEAKPAAAPDTSAADAAKAKAAAAAEAEKAAAAEKAKAEAKAAAAAEAEKAAAAEKAKAEEEAAAAAKAKAEEEAKAAEDAAEEAAKAEAKAAEDAAEEAAKAEAKAAEEAANAEAAPAPEAEAEAEAAPEEEKADEAAAAPVDGKTCAVCGETKPKSEYSKAQGKKASGQGKCKACTGN